MAYSPVSTKVGVWFALVDYNGNVVGTCPAVQHYLDEPPTDTKILCKGYKPRKFVGTADEAYAAACNLPESPNKRKSSIDITRQAIRDEEQLMFQHLNRRCNCGSRDIWSECNGRDGDTSMCG